jgi:ATP-dependent Clp endopeptidase proteolytic subunit ClpP
MKSEAGEADLTIYGDIVEEEWWESDVSARNVVKQLQEMDVDIINVYINSYGGSVSAGLAIYNSLKNHKAKIKTYCDGFACSIASVIFMAGEERIMSNASLLMVHNPWMYTYGNAKQLRKDADDLETIVIASTAAYMDRITIQETDLKQLLEDESWITPTDALEWGFATAVNGVSAQAKYSQSVRKDIMQMLTQSRNIQQGEPGHSDTKQEPEQQAHQEPEEEPKQNETKVLKMMGAFFNAFSQKEEK